VPQRAARGVNLSLCGAPQTRLYGEEVDAVGGSYEVGTHLQMGFDRRRRCSWCIRYRQQLA
jgi:pyruvate/2-oxoglutarate/acetoin dehydrogenase E1 component